MNRSAIAAAAFALSIGAAGAASAHHSTAMYDNTKLVEVKGVVKDFEPQNPHMDLYLVVTDGRGQHVLALEGQSVNNLYRLGYRRGMINVGDTITVAYNPLKTGVEGGFFQSITIAGGKVLGLRPKPAS